MAVVNCISTSQPSPHRSKTWRSIPSSSPRVTVLPAAASWDATSWWAGYHQIPYPVRDSPWYLPRCDGCTGARSPCGRRICSRSQAGSCLQPTYWRRVISWAGATDRGWQARPVPRAARPVHRHVWSTVPVPIQCGISHEPQRKGKERSRHRDAPVQSRS